MLNYFLKRLMGLIPTLLIVAVLVFLFVHMLPGDPARMAAGQDADEQTVAMVRQELGLDKPLPQQFASFFGHMLQGDFGTSIRTRRPVSVEIGERFGPTGMLTLTSMVWAVIFALLVGVSAAARHNKLGDVGLMGLTQVGIAIPNFWFAILLILVFSVQLQWFSAGGFEGWGEGIFAGFKSLLLPALSLAVVQAAILARITRSAVLEVIQEDFVRTARAKGVRERTVIAKHCLRNALIPVVTMMGLQFGFLLGGSIVVEAVFNWPGLGRLLVDAVQMRDYPVIQTLVLLFSLEFILINLVVDVLYGYINPTIRYK